MFFVELDLKVVQQAASINLENEREENFPEGFYFPQSCHGGDIDKNFFSQ